MGLFSRNKKDKKNSCCCDSSCAPETMVQTETDKASIGIKVLGSGCAKCNALEQAACEALAELGMETTIDHVTNFTQIAAYGVMTTPALVVDGQVVSYGKVLKKDEAKALIEKVRGQPMRQKPKVAFVCVHNSCRSQIAEALGKLLAEDVFDSYSAGTETKPKINQDAVRLMKQLYGVDMEQKQHSKLLSEIPPVDIVITMGCNVSCPSLPCQYREDWSLDDPTGKDDETFLEVIHIIEKKIFELKDRIDNGML